MQETFLLEDVLNLLIQLEGYGHRHYNQLSVLAKDEGLKKLFLVLSKQELHHLEIYQHYQSQWISFRNEDPVEDYDEYLKALIQSSIHNITNDQSFESFELGFERAVQLEKDTLMILNELQKLLPQKYAPEINILIQEERGHLQFLMRNHQKYDK